MNAARYFEHVKMLPVKDWRELTGEQPFVVLSPHPDDESLGAGGLIALARRNHQDITVILVTDGSGSHPGSLIYPRDRLVATRRSEFEEAGRILGLIPNCLHELGFVDAKSPIEGPEFEEAANTVCEIVRKTGAQSLFVTWRHDPHSDHVAAAALAAEVLRRYPYLKLWAYPIWGWHLAPNTTIPAAAPRGLRLAIDEVQTQKRAAIQAHASQVTDLISDDPKGFRFTVETLAPFLGAYEYFIEVSG
jgi:LmbE family N-acetylglucosaminyl deacetylase